MKLMRFILQTLIFVTQLIGVVTVGIGLDMIWRPLGLIYAGAAMFTYGHLMYRAMESEEIKK